MVFKTREQFSFMEYLYYLIKLILIILFFFQMFNYLYFHYNKFLLNIKFIPLNKNNSKKI